MKERKQLARGSPIPGAAVPHRRLRHRTRSRALVLHRAAVAVSAGEGHATRAGGAAKRLSTDTGFECERCLQCMAAMAILRDHPIERFARPSRVHQILEGTNEIMRVIISRAYAGELGSKTLRTS